MPTGPEGEKRPAGVIGNAVTVIRIATGEEREDHGVAPAKNKTAQELGRAGGRKCAESMTPERRAEIAKKAAAKRWKNLEWRLSALTAKSTETIIAEGQTSE